MGKTIRYVIAAALLGTTLPVSQAEAATLVVDVTGAQSYGMFANDQNTVQTFNIGGLSRITAIAFDVTITAFSPSFLSEASVALTGSDTDGDGVSLNPGLDDRRPGTARYFGAVNLTGLGLDFAVGTDGILRLEYFEDFNDTLVSPDAQWVGGTLTVTYDEVTAAIPEPATWMMMFAGFAMVGGAARYRRRTTRVRYA
ncbi:hypothetical protein GCM10022268_05150 [Sphingomonas cynarae]|uniref:Ice-binding protein C-terminal domain-containing protein n=1 Tax=Sphingomonas cynarae TaxID=930197 RepID=A0ABP7D0J4_9SPHN